MYYHWQENSFDTIFTGVLNSILETMVFAEEDVFGEESEPEEPIYDRQELIEKYHVGNFF